MSRFFRSREEASSDEEEEYSSDEYSESRDGSLIDESAESDFEGGSETSESESSVEIDNDKLQAAQDRNITEATKRVSRSAQQKYADELRDISKSITANLESKNWITILKDFENLVRLRTSGTFDTDPCPRHVARTLATLIEELNGPSSSKESVKKLSPTAFKAFNILKQRIKRAEPIFEESVKAWLENPVSETASAVEHDELEKQKSLLKIESEDEESGEFIDKKDKKARRAHRRDLSVRRAQKVKEEGEAIVEKPDHQKKKVFEPKYEDLFAHLERILYERGKKGADKFVHVQKLEALLKLAVKPEEKCKILAVIIPARIDLSSASKTVMTQNWNSIVAELSDLMDILWLNSDVVALLASEKEAGTDPQGPETLGRNVVYCNITTYLKGIYKEFTRSLQEIDPKTTEYITRMKDEVIIYILSLRVQKYFEKKGDKEQAIYAALRRLKHIYYKPNIVIEDFEKKARDSRKELHDCLEPSENIVKTLALMLSKSTNERIRTYSFLAYVYNLALNDKLYEARDLMLMSHIQNNIHKADTSNQILYNRTIVQIGLCAFRNSSIKMTVSCLYEIIHSGRSRELLAQGIPPQKSFNRFKKKTETQRTLPYFMHINIELIECVYLTCSMLLEMPTMVIGSGEPGRRVTSRQFCRMIEYNERQVFVGPPENVRDHITAASLALSTGDWKKCRDYIHSIKLWDLMSNPAAIRDMLTQKIKEEAVRIHLFIYSSGYKTIDMNTLVEYFEIPLPKIKTIVSRMIAADEVDAYIDDRVNIIVLDKGSKQDVTKLQQLALVYCEKLTAALENNEKIAEGLSLGPASHISHRDHRDRINVYAGYQAGGLPKRDNRSGPRTNMQGRYRDNTGGATNIRPHRQSFYTH